MAFQKASVVKVENGYMVSLTRLEVTDRGFQPQDSHYIAKDLNEVVDFILEREKTASVIELHSVKKES